VPKHYSGSTVDQLWANTRGVLRLPPPKPPPISSRRFRRAAVFFVASSAVPPPLARLFLFASRRQRRSRRRRLAALDVGEGDWRRWNRGAGRTWPRLRGKAEGPPPYGESIIPFPPVVCNFCGLVVVVVELQFDERWISYF